MRILSILSIISVLGKKKIENHYQIPKIEYQMANSSVSIACRGTLILLKLSEQLLHFHCSINEQSICMCNSLLEA